MKEWEESDFCQICQGPFLWSFKQMYQDRVVGKRQVSQLFLNGNNLSHFLVVHNNSTETILLNGLLISTDTPGFSKINFHWKIKLPLWQPINLNFNCKQHLRLAPLSQKLWFIFKKNCISRLIGHKICLLSSVKCLFGLAENALGEGKRGSKNLFSHICFPSSWLPFLLAFHVIKCAIITVACFFSLVAQRPDSVKKYLLAEMVIPWTSG